MANRSRFGLYVLLTIGVLAGLGGALYWTLYAMPSDPLSKIVNGEPRALTEELPDIVSREGYILTGHPELKPDVWYIVHSEEGNEALAAELSFDGHSICGRGDTAGTCRPDLFINKRAARVEGEWVNGALLVHTLTFTQALE